MAVVNKVILIGNLGRDPEVKQTPSGSKVANFSIATTEKYKDQQGNNQEKTEWHNLVAWNRQAEVIEQYARKGTSLYVEGSLSTRSWDDQATGQKRYKTEIVVRSFQFLGSKSDNQGGYSTQSQSAGASGYNSPNTNTNNDFGGGNNAPDDDLPF